MSAAKKRKIDAKPVKSTPAGEGAKKSDANERAGKKRSAMKIGEIKGGAIYVMQAGTPVYIKTADVCALTGKTNQWIGQLTAEGIINKKKTAHGSLYDLRDTISAYIEMLEARLDKRNASSREVELDRARHDARIKAARAELLEADAAERSGRMHRSEDVAAMTSDLIFTLRSSLLAFPARVANDLVGIKTAAEASDIVDREIRKIMQEMSMYKYDPAKYEEKVRERLKLERRALLDEELEEE